MDCVGFLTRAPPCFNLLHLSLATSSTARCRPHSRRKTHPRYLLPPDWKSFHFVQIGGPLVNTIRLSSTWFLIYQFVRLSSSHSEGREAQSKYLNYYKFQSEAYSFYAFFFWSTSLQYIWCTVMWSWGTSWVMLGIQYSTTTPIITTCMAHQN